MCAGNCVGQPITALLGTVVVSGLVAHSAGVLIDMAAESDNKARGIGKFIMSDEYRNVLNGVFGACAAAAFLRVVLELWGGDLRSHDATLKQRRVKRCQELLGGVRRARIMARSAERAASNATSRVLRLLEDFRSEVCCCCCS
jgi:hypothetical protein